MRRTPPLFEPADVSIAFTTMRAGVAARAVGKWWLLPPLCDMTGHPLLPRGAVAKSMAFAVSTGFATLHVLMQPFASEEAVSDAQALRALWFAWAVHVGSRSLCFGVRFFSGDGPFATAELDALQSQDEVVSPTPRTEALFFSPPPPPPTVATRQSLHRVCKCSVPSPALQPSPVVRRVPRRRSHELYR